MHHLLVLATIIAAHRGPARWFQYWVATFFDPDWNQTHRSAIWTTIVMVLFLAGLGFPVPEDVPLTISGFTTFKQSGDRFVWWQYVTTLALVIAPILAGDIVTYSIGRRWGFALPARVKLIGRLLPENRLARVQRWFDHYGNFTVFLGRQIAGVRFVTFFSAGAMRMPLVKFVVFDFLGCLVSVPIWLTIGTLAAIHGKEWLDVVSRKVGHGFLLGGIAVFVLFYVVMKLRALRRARLAQAETALLPTPPPPTEPTPAITAEIEQQQSQQ